MVKKFGGPPAVESVAGLPSRRQRRQWRGPVPVAKQPPVHPEWVVEESARPATGAAAAAMAAVERRQEGGGRPPKIRRVVKPEERMERGGTPTPPAGEGGEWEEGSELAPSEESAEVVSPSVVAEERLRRQAMAAKVRSGSPGRGDGGLWASPSPDRDYRRRR